MIRRTRRPSATSISTCSRSRSVACARSSKHTPGSLPIEGSGAHPAHPGSGWSGAFNAQPPASAKALHDQLGLVGEDINHEYVLWTEDEGKYESFPVSLV